jgi:hypothetical protein
MTGDQKGPPLTLPMPFENLEALNGAEQRQAYIDGSMDVISGAVKKGWIRRGNMPLSSLLDEVATAARIHPDGSERELFMYKLGNLFFLEGTNAIMRMYETDGVEVSFDDAGTPQLSILGAIISNEAI